MSNYTFSFYDLWPYVIISIVFFYVYATKAKNGSKVVFITLLLFSILRYDVGWDYTTYQKLIESDYSYILNSRFELLSMILILIGNITSFYPLTFALFSFLTLYFFYKSLSEFSVYPVISWLVFYSIPILFFSSLSTLRHSLAIILVFYSFRFIYHKEYIKFFFTIFISSLFHITSLIGLIILPLSIFPISRLVNSVLFFASFFFSTFILGFIQIISFESTLVRRYLLYINELNFAEPNLIMYLYYSFGILNLIYFKKLIGLDRRNQYFITLYNFGIVVFNSLSFEAISSLRLSAFFLIFLVYIIPCYHKLFINSSKVLVRDISFSLLLSLSFFYLFLMINPFIEGTSPKISFIPYRFWLFNL